MNNILEKRKEIKKGDWIITCSMKPLQFSHYIVLDESDYDKRKFTPKEWELFIQFNDFQTLDGSNHSASNCSLKPISEEYAIWFIENKCWNIYDSLNNNDDEIWDQYEQEIKNLCNIDGIKYVGY